jgi:hypothetical protein
MTMTTTRNHPDQVVRLHGGPLHGRIVPLPRRDTVILTWPELTWLECQRSEVTVQPVLYHRATIATYDDVDDATDYWDYWHASGHPPPQLGHSDRYVSP